VYTVEEEEDRFNAFVSNLKLADMRNADETKGAEHGVTKFMDLTPQEFKARYLGYSKANLPEGKHFVESHPPLTSGAIQDWTGNYTTPVKNQGHCGSCWAFSATEQLESDAMRSLGVSYVLSPEQITQCATKAYGCNGGWTEVAYAYVKSAGGIETDANYPYTSYNGVTGTCKATASKYVLTVTSYSTLSSESSMASYVQTKGPLSICIDANNWNSYTGGIMSVCGNSVDHCVQAVGVDASTGGYWKVRNSWGTSWGEAGHIRLAYGKNTCAITNDPTYAVVQKL
jgi:C1A family cysteine protease